jgi:hypothetical protein
MTETQQRFLRAIAERVPMDQVVELHLFPPIRQGGVETGVAVVAEAPKRATSHVPDSPSNESPVAAVDTPEMAPHVVEPEPVIIAEADVVVEGAIVGDAVAEEAVVEVVAHDAAELDDSPYAVSASDEDADDLDDEDPYGDDDDLEDDEDDVDEDDIDVDDEDADDVLTGAAKSAARVASRLTIHTARYRLTLKGVDRGKWEVDVVAEADAPLAALDAVVRGVQRRAGEGAEPDRLSAEALRDALEAPLASLER